MKNTNCPDCNKALIEKVYSYPDYEFNPTCDYCERSFCSEECIRLEAYEDTFYNCCPGTYWCAICRNAYLEEAKGHIFTIAQHPADQNLVDFVGLKEGERCFVDQCTKCGMYGYEFHSKTQLVSKYEKQSCDQKIRSREIE